MKTVFAVISALLYMAIGWFFLALLFDVVGNSSGYYVREIMSAPTVRFFLMWVVCPWFGGFFAAYATPKVFGSVDASLIVACLITAVVTFFVLTVAILSATLVYQLAMLEEFENMGIRSLFRLDLLPSLPHPILSSLLHLVVAVFALVVGARMGKRLGDWKFVPILRQWISGLWTRISAWWGRLVTKWEEYWNEWRGPPSMGERTSIWRGWFASWRRWFSDKWKRVRGQRERRPDDDTAA